MRGLAFMGHRVDLTLIFTSFTEATPLTYMADENTALRRPSHAFLDNPIGSFKGPNSLHNFASSFTRAQVFSAQKLDNDINRKRSFFVSPSNHRGAPGRGGPDDSDAAIDDEDEELYDPDLMIPSQRGQRLSTVLHDINAASISRNLPFLSDQPDVFYTDDYPSIVHTRHNLQIGSGSTPMSIGQPVHHIHSKLFASMRSGISALTTASRFTLKQIEDKDGKVLTVLSGQSTAPQTTFNSINVLIGVGLLALPVGIMKAGWLVGIPLLAICGLVTFWTATLLSRLMDTDATIMTYADLGYAAYGARAKLAILILFSIDLIGAGVALNVLMSDLLYALLQGGGEEDVFAALQFFGGGAWTKTHYKLLCFAVLTPFTFLPLPILSIFSLCGIVATVSITVLVLVLGLAKQTAPGSLLSIMPTNLYPQLWQDLLLLIGILMAPFGGHAIFPNLKSDMRHPHKFARTLVPTYATLLITDMLMGILGFLMFGATCNNEITNNILFTQGYPTWSYPLLSGLICLVPLAKTPLNAKPIILTIDVMLGVDSVSLNASRARRILTIGMRFFVRIGVNAAFVALAILFPEFDRVIGILGASICFLICIILPCLFHLKLCDDIPPFERVAVKCTIAVSLVLAAVGSWAVVTF